MGPIELPAPVSVVPAEVAEAILRIARHEVAVLEVELAEVDHEASSLAAVGGRAHELDLRDGVASDPRRDLEVERRLGDFLEAWRRADEDELNAAIEAARARAEMRVRLAHVEAGAILAAARDAAQGRDLFGAAPVLFATDQPAPTDLAVPTDEPAPTDLAVPTDEPAPTDLAVPTDEAVPDWLARVLAALDRSEPADAVAAVAALTADGATQPTGDALAPGDSQGDSPGEVTPPAALGRGDEGFERFWNYEGEGPGEAVRGPRLSEWVPMWGVVPMLVVVVLVALASAWTG